MAIIKKLATFKMDYQYNYSDALTNLAEAQSQSRQIDPPLLILGIYIYIYIMYIDEEDDDESEVVDFVVHDSFTKECDETLINYENIDEEIFGSVQSNFDNLIPEIYTVFAEWREELRTSRILQTGSSIQYYRNKLEEQGYNQYNTLQTVDLDEDLLAPRAIVDSSINIENVSPIKVSESLQESTEWANPSIVKTTEMAYTNTQQKLQIRKLETTIENLNVGMLGTQSELEESRRLQDKLRLDIADLKITIKEKNLTIDFLNNKVLNTSEDMERNMNISEQKDVSDQLMSSQAENLELKMQVEQKRFTQEEMARELAEMKEERWKLDVFSENREKVIGELKEQADNTVAEFTKSSKKQKLEINRLRKEAKEKGFKLYQIEQENRMLKENHTLAEGDLASTLATKDTEIERKMAVIKERDEIIKGIREECHKLTLNYSTQKSEGDLYKKRAEEFKNNLDTRERELHALQVQFDMITKMREEKRQRTISDVLQPREEKLPSGPIVNSSRKEYDTEDYSYMIKKLSGKARDIEIAHENMERNYNELRKESKKLKYELEEAKVINGEKGGEIESRDLLIVQMKKDLDALHIDLGKMDAEYVNLNEKYMEATTQLKSETANRIKVEKENDIYKKSDKINENEFSKRLLEGEEIIQSKIREIEKFQNIVISMERSILEKDKEQKDMEEQLKMANMIKGYIKDSLVELLLTAGLGEEHSFDEQENFDFDYIIQQLKTFLHAHSETNSAYSHPDNRHTTIPSKKLFKTFIEKCPLE